MLMSVYIYIYIYIHIYIYVRFKATPHVLKVEVVVRFQRPQAVRVLIRNKLAEEHVDRLLLLGVAKVVAYVTVKKRRRKKVRRALVCE